LLTYAFIGGERLGIICMVLPIVLGLFIYTILIKATDHSSLENFA